MWPSPRRVVGRLRSSPASPSPFPTLTHRLATHKDQAIDVAVRSESDWWVYNEVFVDGDYDLAIREALARVRDSRHVLVLDLGANAGYFTARTVQLWCEEDRPPMEVYLFEGSPTVHEDLRGRLHGQAVPGVAVHLVHGLVGDRSGHGEIAEVPFGARNTLHPVHNAGIMAVEDMERHRVRFVDLDALVPEGPVALLKCDVEGSEQRVLETYSGTLLPRVQVAVLELHHRLVDVARCLELVAAAGLRPLGEPVEAGDTSLMTFARPR